MPTTQTYGWQTLRPLAVIRWVCLDRTSYKTFCKWTWDEEPNRKVVFCCRGRKPAGILVEHWNKCIATINCNESLKTLISSYNSLLLSGSSKQNAQGPFSFNLFSWRWTIFTVFNVYFTHSIFWACSVFAWTSWNPNALSCSYFRVLQYY